MHVAMNIHIYKLSSEKILWHSYGYGGGSYPSKDYSLEIRKIDVIWFLYD